MLPARVFRGGSRGPWLVASILARHADRSPSRRHGSGRFDEVWTPTPSLVALKWHVSRYPFGGS
eukprot:scaffold42087_cov30-Phaeocystis_antarctica.AAC.2